MPNTVTAQTSALQVASIAGKQYINRFLYNNLLFCPEIMNVQGQPTNNFGPQGEVRPKLVNLSSYFGRDLQKGTTINVPVEQQRYYAQVKNEGVSLAPQTANFGAVPLTVTTMTSVYVVIENYQSYFNNVQGHKTIVQDSMLAGLCQDVENRTFAQALAATNVQGGGSGVAATVADLRTAARNLRIRNVPRDLAKFAIVTPYYYDAIADSFDEYQLAGQDGANSIKTGQLPFKKIYDFNVFESNSITTVGNAAYNMVFADGALMFAVGYQPKFEEAKIIKDNAIEMEINVIFAVGIKRQEYLQVLQYDDTNNL